MRTAIYKLIKANNKKTIKFLVLLFIFPSISQAGDIKNLCNVLASKFNELNKSLPISIDHMTKYTSGSAYYLSGKCNINYNHLIDTDLFIRELKEGALDTIISQEELDSVKSKFPTLSDEEISDISNDLYSEYSIKMKDKSSAIEFINNEVREFLYDEFKAIGLNSLKATNSSILNIDNINIYNNYGFDDSRVLPFRIEIHKK